MSILLPLSPVSFHLPVFLPFPRLHVRLFRYSYTSCWLFLSRFFIGRIYSKISFALLNFRSFRALHVVLHAHFLPSLRSFVFFSSLCASISPTTRRHEGAEQDAWCPRCILYARTGAIHARFTRTLRHTLNGLHGRRNKIIVSALRSKVNLRERGRAVKLTFAWPALSFALYCRAGIDLRESRPCLAFSAKVAV